MKFYDWLDTLGLNLEVTRYARQEGGRCVHIEQAEVKEGSMLCGAHGNSINSVDEAVNDYLSQIRGELLIVGAYSSDRKEYFVPSTVEDV